jgi:hypothetical protein
MTPEGVATPARKPSRDETLVKALVRAHRWRRKIESGRAKSIIDLAEQEGVTNAYVCRLLPLTCLAPDLVEAILDGRQPKGLRLAEMLGNGPLVWNAQRETWGFSKLTRSGSERFGPGAAQLVPKLKQIAGQRESQTVCSVTHGSRRVEQVTSDGRV